MVGISLDDAGSTVAIGAIANQGNGYLSGHVRVYGNPSLVIHEHLTDTELAVYPTPTTGKITIQAAGIKIIEMMNLQGELVSHHQIKNINKDYELALCSQAKGIYIIKVITDKQTITRKLIKH